MTTYTMTTISSNTRIRDQSNTAGNVLASVAANVVVTGDVLFTATVPISTYQAVGDKWLHVTYNGVTGWMALVNMGAPICKDFTVVADPPPATSPFPDTFILENGTTHERATYVRQSP